MRPLFDLALCAQAFKHSSLVKKATADNDEPVPGYLFHEVKQACDVSQEASKRIQDYLLDRLEHKVCLCAALRFSALDAPVYQSPS